jgi:succinate dehydrogenase / fumarate reductase cytochrome b subunit
MTRARKLSTTTVAKKFLIALSGLGIVGYVVIHLLGNLSLYRTDGTVFNAYAAQLHSYPTFVIFAEVILLGIFLAHIIGALTTKKQNLAARPIGYRKWQTKGGDTPSNFSSRTMAISGIILLP